MAEDLSEEDARSQLQMLKQEMEEFESTSAEIEAALEEEKSMLEMDLDETEKKVATLQTKVERMEQERIQLINQRD